jgi:Fe2+ or Zn2+ uptake regulation protein
MTDHSFPTIDIGTRSEKKEQLRMELHRFILLCAAAHRDFVEAETLWLELVAADRRISITTFYNMLRQLVDASLLEKKALKRNKFVYRISEQNVSDISEYAQSPQLRS